jgi:hypothetical protein
MDDFHARLTRRFHRQQKFAAAYSPLYARLFGLVAGWLKDNDPVAQWLLRAGAGRSSFDIPLLLMAGVHRDVLAGDAAVAGLAQYYPSVGGRCSWTDDNLVVEFRRAILTRQSRLAAFLSSATVQTNETSRGLCWLLPVLSFAWPAIHLVDLGASAGLNLVADYRDYRLITADTGMDLFHLGNGSAPSFVVRCEGDFIPPQRGTSPVLLSRSGCDLAPFFLRTSQDEHTLAAFVWGDQPERLAMLRRGIATLHRAARSAAPVQLYRADLPDELSRFLDERITPLGEEPVVIYNTYLAQYLYDKGISLRAHLADWARQRRDPVLWLQWEPLREGPESPEFGWVGWTADLWQQDRHRHWHLAWAHPHGTRIRWLSDQEQLGYW